jgi:hypothetical protein
MAPISPSPILLDYIIYTTNTALAIAWQAANPSGVLAGPNALAASQGLTVNYSPTAIPDPSGCWFYAGWSGGPFNPNDFAHFDKTVDSGFVDPNDLYTDHYNNWDVIEYKWYGTIMPYYLTAPIVSPPPIAARRWAVSFDIGTTGNAALGSNDGNCSPSGSRTTDGYGFVVQPSGADMTMITAPAGAGTTSAYDWERFYLRPWTLPNQGEVAIWSAKDTLEATAAVFLTMNTSGQLVLRSVGNAGVPGTVLGTSSALTLGTWVKIDVLLGWATSGPTTDGHAQVFINGASVISGTVLAATNNGLGTVGAKHASSRIGGVQSFAVGGLTPTTYKYDLDDWISVVQAGFVVPTGTDFLNGTHIRPLNVTGIAAAGAWTGDFRGLAGNPPGVTPPNQMTTSTPSSQLILTTDYVNLPQLGLVSVAAYVWPSTWPASVVAKVGYRLNGGGLTQNTATVVGSINQFCGQVFAVGSALRTDVTSIDLSLDKDAGGSTMGIAGFYGAAEYCGIWGPEDVPAGTTPSRPPVARTGIHNAPYPELSSVTFPLQTMQWASARMGTYTGNGTGQDIAVGIPFHWLWIRNLSANVTEYWWSSCCAVHRGLNGQISGPIDVGMPLPFPPQGSASTSFRVSGAVNYANQAGVVYQWIAFSDPDSRFLLNGACAWTAVTKDNALQDPAFTPVCVFTAQEDLNSSITGFFYHGPGNATDTANPLTGADVSAVMTTAAGILTTKANANSRNPQTAFSAWRTVDGTGASGIVDCVTYTGDGLSSRNIAVNLNGNSPLFAFGIAHTLVSYFRDPSHTGLDSTQINSGLVSTAIIGGGINYVTVGASLNVAGRVYDIFVLAGGAFAGGWTPNTSGGFPVIPTGIPPLTVSPTPPPLSTGPPVVPVPPHGWWYSDAGFRGDVTAIGDSRPADPRSWKDFVGFATGSAAMLGGSPGIAGIVRNHLIYAASGYTVGTDAPPIHLFGGAYDRELTTIPPPSAGAVAHGVVSILVANGQIYVSTWDAGTDSTTWVGRVFSLDVDSATLTPIGDPFPTGHLPYALAWVNSQLWCGTHRQNPSAAGKIYTIRPGVDTTWTEDFDLATVSQGGVASLTEFRGALYVGTTAAAGTFAKILARAADGTYSAVDTGTGGAAKDNNGYLSLAVFEDALYAGYWNNDTTAIAKIRRSADGVTWTTAYTGAAGTLRPFIAMLVDDGFLVVVGGGLGLAAAVVTTDDGVTWLDVTPQLPEADKTAAPAIGVVVQ